MTTKHMDYGPWTPEAGLCRAFSRLKSPKKTTKPVTVDAMQLGGKMNKN